MKRIFVVLVCIAIGLGLLILWGNFIFPTAGTGSLNFTASPSVQGVGGTTHLSLSAGFGGWCGVSVFSPSMEAKLNLPRGLQLIQEPKKAVFPEVQVPPGKSRSSEVTWDVKVLEPGDYKVTVDVTGKYDQRFKVNGSARQLSIDIGGKEVPSISQPALSKEFPDPQSDIEISAKITSSSPISNAKIIYTVNGTDTEVPMLQQSSSDNWSASIPKQNHNSVVKYRFVISDTQGRLLETSPFEYRVLDPVKVNNLPLTLIWAFFILSLIILFVYLFIRAKAIRKMYQSPQIGALPMGADMVNIKAAAEGKPADNLIQIRKTRHKYFFIFLAIAIVLVLIGIVANQFVDVAKLYW